MFAYRKSTGDHIWIRSREKPVKDYVFVEVFEKYVHGRVIANDVHEALRMLKEETVKELKENHTEQDIKLLQEYLEELNHTIPNDNIDKCAKQEFVKADKTDAHIQI